MSILSLIWGIMHLSYLESSKNNSAQWKLKYSVRKYPTSACLKWVGGLYFHFAEKVGGFYIRLNVAYWEANDWLTDYLIDDWVFWEILFRNKFSAVVPYSDENFGFTILFGASFPNKAKKIQSKKGLYFMI